MSFADYIKAGWEAAKLNAEMIRKLSTEKEGIGPAIGILAISGIAFGIGSFSLGGMFLWPIIRVIGGFIFVAIVHFIATTFFEGKGQLTGLALPVFCASVIAWVTIIPVVGPVILGPLTGLWLLVVTVFSVELIYGIDRARAIAVVAIPFVVFLVIAFFLFLAGLSILALSGRFFM
ncbi:MAG: hypothetical protein JXB46_05240 [Candidatus Eisenbacteria bacterium]|nr:hypothetical protein [Candidatus Eisenbacteria bacterium]